MRVDDIRKGLEYRIAEVQKQIGKLQEERRKIDEKLRDFSINRWFLFTENQDAFYIVEIGYSPQVSVSIQTWNELQDLMRSFRIISSKAVGKSSMPANV